MKQLNDSFSFISFRGDKSVIELLNQSSDDVPNGCRQTMAVSTTQAFRGIMGSKTELWIFTHITYPCASQLKENYPFIVFLLGRQFEKRNNFGVSRAYQSWVSITTIYTDLKSHSSTWSSLHHIRTTLSSWKLHLKLEWLQDGNIDAWTNEPIFATMRHPSPLLYHCNCHWHQQRQPHILIQKPTLYILMSKAKRHDNIVTPYSDKRYSFSSLTWKESISWPFSRKTTRLDTGLKTKRLDTGLKNTTQIPFSNNIELLNADVNYPAGHHESFHSLEADTMYTSLSNTFSKLKERQYPTWSALLLFGGIITY